MFGEKTEPNTYLESDSDSRVRKENAETDKVDKDDDESVFGEVQAQEPRPYVPCNRSDAEAESFFIKATSPATAETGMTQDNQASVAEGSGSDLGSQSEGHSRSRSSSDGSSLVSVDSQEDTIAIHEPDQEANQEEGLEEENPEEEKSQSSESDSGSSLVSVDSAQSVGIKRKQLTQNISRFGHHVLLQYHLNDLSTQPTKKPKAPRATKRTRVEASTERTNATEGTKERPKRTAQIKQISPDEQNAYILSTVESWHTKERAQNWYNLARKVGLTTAQVKARWQSLTSNTTTKTNSNSTSSNSATFTVPTSTLRTTPEQDAYLLNTVENAVRKKSGVYWTQVANKLNCSVEAAKQHWQKLNYEKYGSSSASNGHGTSGSGSSGGGGNGTSSNTTMTEINADNTTSVTNNDSNTAISTDLRITQYVLQCVRNQPHLIHPVSNSTIPSTSTTTTSTTNLSILWRQLGVELGIKEQTLQYNWENTLQRANYKLYGEHGEYIILKCVFMFCGTTACKQWTPLRHVLVVNLLIVIKSIH